jgi:S1-C subfamily serine protease
MELGTSDSISSDGGLSLQSASGGVLVSGVRGSARKLGISLGDTINLIDNKPVRTPEDLMDALRSSQTDKHILSIIDGTRKRSVQISAIAWRRYLTPNPPKPPSISAEPPQPPSPPPTN